MAVFKCKMCGGTLNIENGATVAECEFCGRKQTIPKLDDEKRVQSQSAVCTTGEIQIGHQIFE